MLASQTNLTNESIKIGEFDNRQFFHFCVLQFRNIKDIIEQGRIVECYLQNKNFLLLPRNDVKSVRIEQDGSQEESHYYTSLLLIWDKKVCPDNDNTTIDTNEWVGGIKKMIEVENNIYLQTKVIMNNGEMHYSIPVDKMPMVSDNEGQYSYLITHRFVNNKFAYRITSTSNFKNHFSLLAQHNLNANTILDLVFTGRNSNEYHNCYGFGGYKVKDSYISENSDRVILSNVKGLLDLEKCQSPMHYVTFYDLLPDWNSPITIPGYYSGMSLKVVKFIPETQITIDKGNVLYKGNRIDASSNNVLKVVLPIDEELRYEIIKELFSNGQNGAAMAFLSSKETLETILEKFDRNRIEQEKRNLIEQRDSILGNIAHLRRDIQDLNEKIALSEFRTKEFIPFPDIILPEKEIRMPIYDLFSILSTKDGQYIIEERSE